jgi:hypothetical protein
MDATETGRAGSTENTAGMDEIEQRIAAARTKRELGQALELEGLKELAAALADARKQSGSTARPVAKHLRELAGLKNREAVHRLIRWHEERGAEGSPWRG